MLKVHRVGERHPRLDRQIERLGGAEIEIRFGVAGKIGNVVQRLDAVEGPDQSPLLGGRKSEQVRRFGDFVGGGNFSAYAVLAVLPMMERAADVIADDFAEAQVGAEMAAERAHHCGASALATIRDHTVLEDVAADGLAGENFVGARDRIPRLMKPGP